MSFAGVVGWRQKQLSLWFWTLRLLHFEDKILVGYGRPCGEFHALPAVVQGLHIDGVGNAFDGCRLKTGLEIDGE